MASGSCPVTSLVFSCTGSSLFLTASMAFIIHPPTVNLNGIGGTLVSLSGTMRMQRDRATSTSVRSLRWVDSYLCMPTGFINSFSGAGLDVQSAAVG